MTKFEQIGLLYQDGAINKEGARRSFLCSCKACVSRGLRIDCDRCAIAHRHALVAAAFDTLEELELEGGG